MLFTCCWWLWLTCRKACTPSKAAQSEHRPGPGPSPLNGMERLQLRHFSVPEKSHQTLGVHRRIGTQVAACPCQEADHFWLEKIRADLSDATGRIDSLDVQPVPATELATRDRVNAQLMTSVSNGVCCMELLACQSCTNRVTAMPPAMKTGVMCTEDGPRIRLKKLPSLVCCTSRPPCLPCGAGPPLAAAAWSTRTRVCGP